MAYKFSFEEMVNEAYQNMEMKQKKSLILPDMIFDISVVRLHWKNIKDYLQLINRDSDHFIAWLKSEIPGKEINWYSNNISDGIIIHGKYQKKKEITDLSLKYVMTFVICPSCKSPETIMTKEQFICSDCGMTRFI